MTWAVLGKNGEREIPFALEPNSVFVYALIDPRDNTVRYVGASEDLKKRIVQHRGYKGTDARGKWADELRHAGLQMQIAALEKSDRIGAHDLERKWILFYRGLGAILNVKNSSYSPCDPNSNPHEIRQIAVEAQVDPKTVMRHFALKPVRALTKIRIEKAVTKLMKVRR